MTDENIITAGSSTPVEFAYHILKISPRARWRKARALVELFWQALCEGPAEIARLAQAGTLEVSEVLKSGDVSNLVQGAIAQHGAPAYIRSDNSSEFIAHELQHWLAENRIKMIYIEPGSPWQNGFVEYFHGRFRDECLNREQLWTLTEARVIIEDYRNQYNQKRPHSKFGYQSPARYAASISASLAPVRDEQPASVIATSTDEPDRL